jgi:hypothetical protein
MTPVGQTSVYADKGMTVTKGVLLFDGTACAQVLPSVSC